ncbi:MAG TPA: hypothetical protein VES19_05535 [Candidatus Limnocylindrales bacterium]|nr:hypothetical protein [Candidatus Limnocylindrales bacterium]
MLNEQVPTDGGPVPGAFGGRRGTRRFSPASTSLNAVDLATRGATAGGLR